MLVGCAWHWRAGLLDTGHVERLRSEHREQQDHDPAASDQLIRFVAGRKFGRVEFCGQPVGWIIVQRTPDVDNRCGAS